MFCEIPFPGRTKLTRGPQTPEVKKALDELKNDRAPGVDIIKAELLKKSGERLINHLHELVIKI